MRTEPGGETPIAAHVPDRGAVVSRVLLVVPPNPHLNRTPSVSLRYLAAALLERGHEVRAFDPTAPFGPAEEVLHRWVSTWEPQIIGVTLYADSALSTYRLLEAIPESPALRVAGGAHATAVPGEPLRRGFHVVVLGEGERTISDLADRIGGDPSKRPRLDLVRGIAYRENGHAVRRTPPRPRVEDLDTLPPPYRGAGVFPRSWYLPRGRGGLGSSLFASRGCGGACIFCTNRVTGRGRRAHSPARVVEEVRVHLAREGRRPITFHDDAFTADRGRLFALLAAFRRDLPALPPWWCQTRADRFDAAIARSLREAGCRTVVFGLESGDPEILRRIGKGILPEHGLRAVRAAREAGLSVYANFMLGFPGEEVRHLEATLRYMERLAPDVHVFSPLGIVTPYPGTELYRRHAGEYGFRDWWLDPALVDALYAPLPLAGFGAADPRRALAILGDLEEALLDVDFFHYPPEVKAAVRRCLAFRRAHNRDGLTESPARLA